MGQAGSHHGARYEQATVVPIWDLLTSRDHLGSFLPGPLGDGLGDLFEFSYPKGENLSTSLHLSSAEGCSWAHINPHGAGLPCAHPAQP